MELDITWTEVFAQAPLEGNLLPVLTGADDVSTDVMAAVARRFQQSETSFVQEATDAGADYRHRIFTIAGEIPFAGHPSLGTAAVVAHRRAAADAALVQQTISGLQRLRVRLDGTTAQVDLEQNPVAFGATPDVSGVLAALGLDASARHAELPAQIVSTGLPALVVPLTDLDALASIELDRPALRAAVAALDSSPMLNVYLVVETGPGHWRARMMSADLPAGEDPATGSAAGPFGAYADRHLGTPSISIDQGVEMGSPSHLLVDVNDGVVVSGNVRIIGAGRHEVPVDGD